MSLDRRVGAKRIAVVGVTDEETAHLRLLMRKAESELSHAWTWDGESNADLLVVDPSNFAGQMALTRAQSGGRRCAIFSDVPAPEADLVLQRPLKLANVVEVLNTGIEAACDAVSREFNIDIQLAKDCGSLAVLISVVLTAGVWIIAVAERIAGHAL